MNREEMRERAASSKALLNDPVLEHAFEELQRQYVQELIQKPLGDLTAVGVHAKLKVLEDVKSQLQSFVNELAFDRGRK